MTGFVTEALRRDHNRSGFRSGVAALDRYLGELAFQDIKRRFAGCFVAVADGGEIAGFYTLAATHLPMNAQPSGMAKKLPRYPIVPAMPMGRLAVSLNFRGHGLGRALIADAVMRTDGFGIGAFALVVDAKDDSAAAFYQANGFLGIPDEERRFFLPIASASGTQNESRMIRVKNQTCSRRSPPIHTPRNSPSSPRCTRSARAPAASRP